MSEREKLRKIEEMIAELGKNAEPPSGWEGRVLQAVMHAHNAAKSASVALPCTACNGTVYVPGDSHVHEDVDCYWCGKTQITGRAALSLASGDLGMYVAYTNAVIAYAENRLPFKVKA